MISGKYIRLYLFFAVFFLILKTPFYAYSEENKAGKISKLLLPIEKNGFAEFRGGLRTQNDSNEKDFSIIEARLQGEIFAQYSLAEIKYKGELVVDGITEKIQYDTRELWAFGRPASFLDIKIGRQVLTWGTGDMVFLNDLFPKDWQAYFIGRDIEYLKAPSDALKISAFSKIANVDVVYTPQFDPDRFINGQYISYWDNNINNYSGRKTRMFVDKPDSWFSDDELALRVFKNIKNYELAFYNYRGYWKEPSGEGPTGFSTFPRLTVYGASARGQLFSGIGNAEIAYYRSNDDIDGSDPSIKNSQMRYLVGYTQDIATNFNASVQYYVEQKLKYSNYKTSIVAGPVEHRSRHVLTFNLVKLLMNQNLRLTLMAYYSPSDNDAYIRPSINYKYTDNLSFESGANIFIGSKPYTFFSRFKKNTNIYASIKYYF